MMEYFSVVTDKDIFENPVAEPTTYILRPTAKGVVIDSDNNVCVYTIHGRSLFPGGGIEDGETPEQAFVREAKEEIGCDVEIDFLLGVAAEFRNKPAKKYEISFLLPGWWEQKATQLPSKRMNREWLLNGFPRKRYYQF